MREIDWRNELYDLDHDWTAYRAAANDYRSRLNWPVFAHGVIVWTTPGATLDALSVPAPIGAATLVRLTAHDTSAPAIRVPGPPDRWTMLAEAGTGPAEDIAELFAGNDIGHAHGGRYHGRASVWGIDLPPTRYPDHEALSWVTPDETPLPRLSVLVDAVFAVLSRPTPDGPLPAE